MIQKTVLDESIDEETTVIENSNADIFTSDQNKEKSTNQIIKKSGIMEESEMTRSSFKSDVQSAFNSANQEYDKSFYSSARYWSIILKYNKINI